MSKSISCRHSFSELIQAQSFCLNKSQATCQKKMFQILLDAKMRFPLEIFSIPQLPVLSSALSLLEHGLSPLKVTLQFDCHCGSAGRRGLQRVTEISYYKTGLLSPLLFCLFYTCSLALQLFYLELKQQEALTRADQNQAPHS